MTPAGRAWTADERATLLDAWASRDAETIARLGAAAGARLVLAHLDELARMNAIHAGGPEVVGQRFDRADLLAAIGEALGGEAGIVALDEHGFMRMVAFIAIVSRGKLAIAIGKGYNAGTTIGDLWPELKPWFRNAARNRARADLWVATSNAPRIVIDLVTAAPDDRAAPRAMTDVERGLFDAVCADLASDAPRAVYADWLQEREDPRGEMIALALRKPTPKSKKRLKELRLAHLADWLGPLAEFVDANTVALERGFLSSVTTIKANGPFDADKRERWVAALADPRWRTVETLNFYLAEEDVRLAVASPWLTQLRVLTGVSLADLSQLAKGPARPLETAEVSPRNDDAVDNAALRTLKGLPKLQVLHTSIRYYADRPANFKWLVKGRAREQLRELNLSCYSLASLPALLPDLVGFTKLEKVDFEGDELLADKRGKLSILVLGDTPVQALERLEDYPKGVLTKVRVSKTGRNRQERHHKRAATEAALKKRVAALGAKLELV